MPEWIVVLSYQWAGLRVHSYSCDRSPESLHPAATWPAPARAGCCRVRCSTAQSTPGLWGSRANMEHLGLWSWFYNFYERIFTPLVLLAVLVLVLLITTFVRHVLWISRRTDSSSQNQTFNFHRKKVDKNAMEKVAPPPPPYCLHHCSPAAGAGDGAKKTMRSLFLAVLLSRLVEQTPACFLPRTAAQWQFLGIRDTFETCWKIYVNIEVENSIPLHVLQCFPCLKPWK